MLQSEPYYFRMTLMGLYLFLLGVLICLLIVEWLTDVMEFNLVAQLLFTILAIFAALFFILIELPIVLRLTIDDNKVVVKNLLTKKSKEFLLENIHSFKITTHIRMHSGIQADLILLRHGETIESISLRYIYNLDQIINELEKHLRNVTEDEYGFLQRIRDQRKDG